MYQRAEAKAKADEKFKAIVLLIVGIFMLTVLAEPLVESVRQFSDSVRIGPFYVSFILVPLATNARTAIAAIRAAKQKRHQTTSLTFSEVSFSMWSFISFVLVRACTQVVIDGHNLLKIADIPQSVHEQHSGFFCSCLGHILSRLDMAFLG